MIRINENKIQSVCDNLTITYNIILEFYYINIYIHIRQYKGNPMYIPEICAG